MHKIQLYAITAMLGLSLPACAQTKKVRTAGSMQILEATRQRTKPGRQEMDPYTIYRFRFIWKSKATPTSGFVWRPDAGRWMETSVAKPVKRPGLGPGDYMVVEKHIELKNIRYGDTLILTTHRHAHDEEPTPAAVKKMPVSSIYYQSSSAPGKWQYTPVTIRVLPDVNLP